ncbi:MAG: DUF481 domain-containing protein [Acidobacteria bacterium]|nr:DUF481 domain-containing protein [Acidobacteriota bacterium]
MKRSKNLVSLFLLLFAPLVTAANGIDEIKMKNGDRLSGKIILKDEESVVIETLYAGAVKIDPKHIDSIASISKNSSVEDKAVESTSLPEKKEEDVKPTTAANAKTEAPKPAAIPEKPKAPPAATVKPRIWGQGPFFGLATGWEGNANMGFSYTTGNSRTTTMTTGLRAVKNGGDDKLTVYARSLWYNNRNLTNNTTTQNAVWGGARYDRNIREMTFMFGSYDFERDRPRNLYFRSVLGGGLGHRFLKTENTEIDILVGGGWNRTWQAGDNTDTPEALFGNTLKHKLTERLRFQHSMTFYQNITDRNEFRFIFDSSLTADITKRIGIHFTIGDRFNNDPVGTARRNDFLFTTGIRWNFGTKK